MPFTIQSNDVAAVPARQSAWYDTDIAILVAGFFGTGVLTGCEVTAQGSPNMTLAVAAGTIQPSAGVAAATVTSGNVTITTAHATLPRIDLVTAAADGTKTVTAGTAAAEPKPPALPSGHIGLAMVDVPAADTAIQTAQITSKRVVVAVGGGQGLPLGLTGAVADTRYVGGTTTLAPTTGTFAVGDYVVTADGHIWVCTTAGSPGTWTDISGTGVADILDLTTAGTTMTDVLAPDGAGGVEWRPEAGAADILDIPTAETDTSLVLAPDGAGNVEFRAEAGGGGGGAFVYPLDAIALDGTYGSTFDFASLAGTLWTRGGDLASGDEAFQKGADGKRFYVTLAGSGGAKDRNYHQAAPTAGDHEFILSLSSWWTGTAGGGANIMIGPAVVDSSGNGIAAVLYQGGFRAINLTAYAHASWGSSSIPTGLGYDPLTFGMHPVWIRLRYAASGTNWYASYSLDGVNWSGETAAYSSSFTWAHLLAGCYYDNGGETKMALNRYNVL
jgi:hypothetical protein